MGYNYPQPSTGSYIEQGFTDEHYDIIRQLTVKQRIFVEEYLASLDPAVAAKQAGFEAKNLREVGKRLLAKPYIARAVELGIERRLARVEVKQEHVLAELCKIGFSNIRNYMSQTSDGDPYVDLDLANQDATAAIKKIKVKEYKDGRGEDARDVKEIEFELYDKLSALRDIGKHLGMFTDKLELSGPGGGPIKIEQVEIAPIQAGTFIDMDGNPFPVEDADFEPVEREQIALPTPVAVDEWVGT